MGAALFGAATTLLVSQLLHDLAPQEVCSEQATELQPRQRDRADPTPFALRTGGNPTSLLTVEQHKIRLRHRYGALFAELELSASEVDRLLDALSSQEQRSFSRPRRGSPHTAPDNEPELARDGAEVEGAVGNAKAVAFE
jgi:hypothetical protein